MHGIHIRSIEATLGLSLDEVFPLAVTEGGKGKPRPAGILQWRNPRECVATQKAAEIEDRGKMARNRGYTCNLCTLQLLGFFFLSLREFIYFF